MSGGEVGQEKEGGEVRRRKMSDSVPWQQGFYAASIGDAVIHYGPGWKRTHWLDGWRTCILEGKASLPISLVTWRETLEVAHNSQEPAHAQR